MHMIGHHTISCNTVVLFLQVVKPAIYQIISIDLFYQPEPFKTGKCDEVKALIVWYFSANRHSINLSFSFHSRPESALHLKKKLLKEKVPFVTLLVCETPGRKDKVLEDISMNNIVVETDAPYLAPVPFRGKRNEPAYLKYVVEKIAIIKNISMDAVAEITTANAEKLFSIL